MFYRASILSFNGMLLVELFTTLALTDSAYLWADCFRFLIDLSSIIKSVFI